MRYPVAAPPPIAPPVVPPPLAEEWLPPAAVHSNRLLEASYFRRALRDFKIGGICLAVGLLVGNSGLLDRVEMQSFSATSGDVATLTPDVPSVNELDSSKFTAQAIAVEETTTSPAVQLIDLPAAESDEVSTEETSAESRPPAIMEQPAVEVDHDVDRSFVVRQSPAELEMIPAHAEPSPPLAAIPSVTSLESLIASASQSQTAVVHPTCEDGSCPQNMKSLGTAVSWADTPADAYRLAAEQRKLVFLIHVSGNFEIPGFT